MAVVNVVRPPLTTSKTPHVKAIGHFKFRLKAFQEE